MKLNSNTRISSGDENLDRALNGGLLEGQSLLLYGPPGSGKTTLAAQFIRDGLSNGEDCLFVSTEQTPEDLNRSLRHIGFDDGQEGLSVTSIHARQGKTIEGEEVVLAELEGNGSGDFQKPFNGNYVKDRLSEYSPCDRIVIDSVSGLEALSTDEELFRREITDTIEFVKRELGATLVLTSEDTDGHRSERLRYAVDGVVRFRRPDTEGEQTVLARVTKMRGTDHDGRRFGVSHDDTGISFVQPYGRDSKRDREREFVSTGCDSLDEFCGGGILGGSTALIEHDGVSDADALVGGIISEAVSSGASVSLMPSPSLLSSYPLDSLDTERLLEEDRLFILDPVGFVECDSPNVFDFGSRFLTSVNEAVDKRRGDRPLVVIGDVNVEVAAFGEEDARRARYVNSVNLGEEDVVVNTVNTDSIDEGVSSFYRSAAEQVLRMERVGGVSVVRLKKCPMGGSGRTRFVTDSSEPPYYGLR